MSPQTDIRELVPRVRRAVEGAGGPAVLSDDQIKDLVADALADVILYTGGAFGKQLLVTARDGATGAPIEYATSDELSLPEGSMIAAQAALTAVYQQVHTTKISETIRDEGQEWSYALSATLLRDRVKQLIDARDRALEAMGAENTAVAFVDLWRERDFLFAYEIAPLVHVPA